MGSKIEEKTSSQNLTKSPSLVQKYLFISTSVEHYTLTLAEEPMSNTMSNKIEQGKSTLPEIQHFPDDIYIPIS
jgi:hypothetical protein